MSQSATMDLLQVAADMRASGQWSASLRVVDEAQPDYDHVGLTAWRRINKGACRDAPEVARRLRVTRWLDWRPRMQVGPSMSVATFNETLRTFYTAGHLAKIAGRDHPLIARVMKQRYGRSPSTAIVSPALYDDLRAHLRTQLPSERGRSVGGPRK